MKIIMATRAVFPYHGYGGMQLYIYNLSKHLSMKGVEVEIVTSYMGKDDVYSEFYDGIKYTFLPGRTSEMHKDNLLSGKMKSDKKGIIQFVRGVVPSFLVGPISFLPSVLFLLRDTFRFLRFSSLVSSYLKDKKFDLLHFYDMSGFHFAKSGNKASVMQAFGNESFFDARPAERVGYVFLRMLIRQSFRLATIVGSCGDLNAKDIVRISGVPISKIRIIQNGINLEKVPSQSKSELRRKLGLPKNSLVFITTNRLSPDKHVDDIINAFKIANIPGSILVSIGSGIMEEELKRIAAGSNVIFLKGIDEKTLYMYLKASDVFINAADTRYLLLTVLEAMASSLAIITTYPMENAVVDGKNGFIVRSGVKNIASAMKRIAAGKKILASMGIHSRKIANSYGWSKVAEEDIRVYKEAIAIFQKRL